jgi:hypothetical protein
MCWQDCLVTKEMTQRTEEQERMYQELSDMLALDGWSPDQSKRWQDLMDSYPILSGEDENVLMWLSEGSTLIPNFLDP